jgi:hypothetical protein
MDQNVRREAGGYGDSPEYEWHWWHNVLGLVTVLAIVVLMSL